ncbi:superinfection immunity protein [Pseudomonas sp. BNK-43-a]|uniref:superinfection immunity protein n=1 Tax=unclassified Pseudomonas TaxID=196821 RepID=UPI0039BF0EC6
MYGGYLLGIALSLVIYFVPMMIAFYRNHGRYTTIFMMNLFLGWTMVVWVICLIWALFGASRIKNASGGSNKYEDLERISRLKSSGDLTEDEYQAEKARLLNQ